MMEISVWSGDDWLTGRSQMERKDRNEGYFLDKVLGAYRDETPPLASVEIETVNRCDGTCSFCPVSAGNDRRPYKMMDDKLFYEIIDQLAGINYRGFISLFSNNEPLLDLRFFDFLAYARRKLPQARHALYTNGSKLTQDNYGQLVSSLDYLYIDNYSDELQILPHLRWLADDRPDDKDCHVRLTVRKKTQVLYNRGGNAPNKKPDALFGSGCILPFMQMVVRPDGKLSLCCQDAYGDVTLGDLSRQSAGEAWKGEQYRNVRRDLLERGRASLQSCQTCDLFGFHNYFPAKWVDGYARTLVDRVWAEIEEGKTICIHSHGYDADHIEALLRHHGIWEIRRVADRSSELWDDACFVIFPAYRWELLERLDPANVRVTEKYLVFHNMEDLQLRAIETRPAYLRESFRKVYAASQSGGLAVFGAGLTAERVVDEFALNVKYYLDNDKEKQRQGFHGKAVRPPEAYTEGDLILIAAMAENEIREQLAGIGIPDEAVVSGSRLFR